MIKSIFCWVFWHNYIKWGDSIGFSGDIEYRMCLRCKKKEWCGKYSHELFSTEIRYSSRKHHAFLLREKSLRKIGIVA